MINKVILVGHLGKDPEVRHFEGNSAVAGFSIATNDSYLDRKTGERVEQTDWHNVVLWNALANVAEKYLKKGSQVYIEGKLVTRKWQDKDGNDRYTTEVLGRTMKMLGGKDGGGRNQPPMPTATDAPQAVSSKPAAVAPTPVANNSTTTTTTTEAPATKAADAVDDDLPF